MTEELSEQVKVLLGGFFIHLCLGCVFLWGNLAPYVLSYYFHYGASDGAGQKDINMYDSVFVIPINLSIVMVTNPVGAYVLKQWRPTPMLIGCTTSLAVTALLASFASTYL